jgi:hypothetical protein
MPGFWPDRAMGARRRREATAPRRGVAPDAGARRPWRQGKLSPRNDNDEMPGKGRMDRTPTSPDAAQAPRALSRREWALVALGLAAWIAIGAGGAWFVHQVTQPREACAAPADAPTRQVKGPSSTGPGNGFQAITGQGRCR